MTAATIGLALAGWYAGAVIYFVVVGRLYPKGNGAAIAMEAALWPYWTLRRLWWEAFGY